MGPPPSNDVAAVTPAIRHDVIVLHDTIVSAHRAMRERGFARRHASCASRIGERGEAGWCSEDRGLSDFQRLIEMPIEGRWSRDNWERNWGHAAVRGGSFSFDLRALATLISR